MNFSIYRFIKSLRSKGYKIKYIDLYGLWVIFCLLACSGVSYFFISAMVNEFQQAKKNYSHYVNQRVELPMLPVITEILQVTKQSSDTVDTSLYYRVVIGENLDPSTRLFGFTVLEKSKTSESWVMQLPYSVNNSYVALFNREWLMFYLINTDRILDEKINSFDKYFDWQTQFKDKKLSVLLTWSPNYFFIYLFNGFSILLLCAAVIVFISLIFHLIYSSQKTKTICYPLDYFFLHPDQIISQLKKGIRITVLKTKNNVMITL